MHSKLQDWISACVANFILCLGSKSSHNIGLWSLRASVEVMIKTKICGRAGNRISGFQSLDGSFSGWVIMSFLYAFGECKRGKLRLAPRTSCSWGHRIFTRIEYLCIVYVESFEAHKTHVQWIFYNLFHMSKFFGLAVPSCDEHLSFSSLNVTIHT
jgi:hypothetical protein